MIRWPDGSIVGLDPEEDVDEVSDDLRRGGDADMEDEEKPRRSRGGAPKPKPAAKRAAKPRANKGGKASDGGRAVHTDYYNHASYDEMPASCLNRNNTFYIILLIVFKTRGWGNNHFVLNLMDQHSLLM